jgi:primosomal replication protein N
LKRNQIILDGVIIAIDTLRYTPGGVATVSFSLSHASEQMEAGAARAVACEVAALALGEVAIEIAKIPAGTAIAVQGFLSRKAMRSDALVLHVNRFKLS